MNLDEFTPELVALAVAKATPEEKKRLSVLLDELKKREHRRACQSDFLTYAKHIWPDMIIGQHHRIIAEKFNAMAEGKLTRLIISIAPRHGKSELASYLLPSWFLGKFPNKKIMQVSNTAELAEGFGSRVRNLVDSDEYREIFPEVELRPDSKARGRWDTTAGSTYYATGVGAALAGRGADLCLAEGSIISSRRRKALPIEDIEVGDKIATASGWERVTRKKLTIHKQAVKINNDVVASPNHPFLTQRGWVEAGDLRVGDKIKTGGLWPRLTTTLAFLLNNLRAKRGKV